MKQLRLLKTKRIIFLLTLIAVFVCNSISCNAESKTINTSAGKLQHQTTAIKDTHYVKSKNILNGKVISESSDEDCSYGDVFVEQIKTSYGDVNIFRESLAGNACPVLYYAITTSKTGGYFKSDSFGNCSEVEKYRKVKQGDVLILEMNNLMKVSEDIVIEIHKDKIVKRSLIKHTKNKKLTKLEKAKEASSLYGILKNNVGKNPQKYREKLAVITSNLTDLTVNEAGDLISQTSNITSEKGYYICWANSDRYSGNDDHIRLLTKNDGKSWIILVTKNGSSKFYSNSDKARDTLNKIFSN